MRNKSFNTRKEFFIILNYIRINFINHKFLFLQNNNKKESKNLNSSSFLKSLLNIIFWGKVRILYFVNNWIYTTNHKRIAVNYFWFVILSGIVGMVLATLIRLEFAYPGVGIFAGDSLQYLSMATAHGVIMVFFMIIPLLFGAFANFLIPTQLGVHDVAFPRLNSAAFWFLPGGLLMLCQLVCVDRRYQRMNCFNIREIQSILKRRFYTDLINTHDHHTFLDKTAMGLRFKTNSINNTNSNIFIFYNYGIEFSPKVRSNVYILGNETSFSGVVSFKVNSLFFYFLNYFNNLNVFFWINNFYLYFIQNLNFINSLNFNFKNIFIYLFLFFNSSVEEIFSSILYFFDLILDSSKSLFNFFTGIFFNFNDFFSKLFPFLSRFDSFLQISFLFYKSLFYNYLVYLYKIYFFNFYLFNQNYLNYILKNFQSFNFWNLFSEFFFYIKFLEVFYFYSYKNNGNFYTYFSYFYFIQYLSVLFSNLVLFFSEFKIFSTTFSLFNVTKDSTNLAMSENNLIENNSSNFRANNLQFNDNFYSKLNYDSYFVYFFIFFYIITSLPSFLISIAKNIFNISIISGLLYDYYSLVTSWYVPVLLKDNVFFYFYKNLNSSFNNSIYLDLNPFFLDFIALTSKSYVGFTGDFNVLSWFTDKVIFVNLIFFNLFYFLSDFFSQVIKAFVLVLFSNKTSFIFSNVYNLFFFKNNFLYSLTPSLSYSYSSQYFNNTSLTFINKYTNEETSNVSRYLRFYNPVFKYDFKSGDYFPKIYKEMYTYLFMSRADALGSLRNAPWFLSSKYTEYFDKNFSNYVESMSNVTKFNNFTIHKWEEKRFTHPDAFYNFFDFLSNESEYFNKKWISLNSLDQKFYRMFNTSSMQQRVYSNWRQLKFTREAWRCKLLAARHQKTLFRRYFHEDGVFWSIERNAKDLLPGWAMITPFSARTRFTAVGKTDIGLMGVFLVLNSSIISGANFLVTYRYLSTLNNRKMRDARVFFTESIIVACWMMIFANPMLAIAILMLLSDRHWQTSFFDYSGGGDTVLFQHMFWFFGHPEVYVIVLPTFGFTNSMISYYLRKRVSARASLMYSMYTIAFLGFFVWGHHMYMVGLSHTTRMLFSTLTVMISVPAATKIMHWCVTTVNSAMALELPLLFTFTFIFLFVSGGISGMYVAHTGMDILFHDTFYVIGHFHVMLSGAAMFGSFGAFYFYFPAIFGVKFSRIYAYLHYSYYLVGQLMTVIPMFWLGYAGMPRRVLDYPASMGGWHSVISAGHMLSVAGLIAFFIMIFDSLRQGKAVIRNTFGISRYNTRLNFYLYEVSRLVYTRQKGLTLFRFVKPNSIKLNDLNYLNFEPFETTIINYSFSKN